METLVKEWPTLVSQTRNGREKFWKIRVVFTNHGGYFLVPEYWQGHNGARQTAPKQIGGKHIGRSNETSSLQQALLEAEAEWKKQRDKGYHLPGEDTSQKLALPMLAKDFTKDRHRLTFPLLGQPKLDGFRCLWHPDLGFWSRQGKRFDEKVDLTHLHVSCGDVILDGELILPAGYSFQDTCKAIKKQNENTPRLQFHVFDLIDPDRPFLARYERLQRIRNGSAAFATGSVHAVEVTPLQQEGQIEPLLQHYLEAGYEGLMLRNAREGGYEIGHRSANLQKYKEFQDLNCRVVGVNEGEGREAGMAILVCETPQGRRFHTRPRGTHEERRAMWRRRDQLPGTLWEVRFQNLTEDGIPRFPVAVREAIDR